MSRRRAIFSLGRAIAKAAPSATSAEVALASCRLATAAKIEGVCPGDRSDVHIIVSAEDWHSHPIASDFGSGVGDRLSAIC